MVKLYHNTPKMKIRLCLWSWILGNDRNGVISTYNDRETGFLRRVRSVTLRENYAALKFIEQWMQNYFSFQQRDPSRDGSAT